MEDEEAEEDVFTLPDKIPEYMEYLHQNDEKDDEISLVPQILTLVSSRQFSSTCLLQQDHDEKKPLPPITDPKFDKIFMKKLKVCKEVYDLSKEDPMTKSLVNKKTDILKEINEYLEKNENGELFSSVAQTELWDMIYLNIFDQDPKFPSKIESANYSVTIVDPLWDHLKYVFDILSHYTQMFFQFRSIHTKAY